MEEAGKAVRALARYCGEAYCWSSGGMCFVMDRGAVWCVAARSGKLLELWGNLARCAGPPSARGRVEEIASLAVKVLVATGDFWAYSTLGEYGWQLWRYVVWREPESRIIFAAGKAVLRAPGLGWWAAVDTEGPGPPRGFLCEYDAYWLYWAARLVAGLAGVGLCDVAVGFVLCGAEDKCCLAAVYPRGVWGAAPPDREAIGFVAPYVRGG